MEELHLIRGKALVLPIDLYADDAETIPLDVTGYTFSAAVYQLDGVQACAATVTVTNTAQGKIRVNVLNVASATLGGSAYILRVDLTDPTGIPDDISTELHVKAV